MKSDIIRTLAGMASMHEQLGGPVRDHFPDVGRMVDLGSGRQREVVNGKT